MIDIKKVRNALYKVNTKPFISNDITVLCETTIFTEELVCLNEALNELERLQHKPTAEEVRKAIEDEIDWNVKVIDNQFYFINGSEEILTFVGGHIKFNFSPSPKLAIMIAKFFEVE